MIRYTFLLGAKPGMTVSNLEINGHYPFDQVSRHGHILLIRCH